MSRESIQFNLVEALRRFECFAVPSGKRWTIEDMTKHNWTGLAYASEMKQTTAKGYMIVDGDYAPRCLGWYKLTAKGAAIVFKWHSDGIKCEDYEVVGPVPFYKDTEKQL